MREISFNSIQVPLEPMFLVLILIVSSRGVRDEDDENNVAVAARGNGIMMATEANLNSSEGRDHALPRQHDTGCENPNAACKNPCDCMVFFVVDVQNGYDNAWLKANGKLPDGEHDFGWNNGILLPKPFFDRINEDLTSDAWDFIVFTQDWLPPGGMVPEEGFPFRDYLAIIAGTTGADIIERLLYASYVNNNGEQCRTAAGCQDTTGARLLLHTKSIDDAMSSDLSNVDLNEEGLPKVLGAVSLPDKLSRLGLTPDKTTIVISGLVTERCVMAAAMAAKSMDYKTYVDPYATMGSCSAATQAPPSDLSASLVGSTMSAAAKDKALIQMHNAGIRFWRGSRGYVPWLKLARSFKLWSTRNNSVSVPETSSQPYDEASED